MKLNELTKVQMEQIAQLAGTSVAYLIQIKNGHRRPSPQLALLIEKASKGVIRKEELIWPEAQGSL